MPQQSYIFGGNTPWTYDQIQQKRKIAEQLAAQIGSPRNVGEGLSAIGKALAVRGLNKRADKRDAELRSEYDKMFEGLGGILGGSGGGSYTPTGTWTPDATPRPQDVPATEHNPDVNLGFADQPPVDMANVGSGNKMEFGAAAMTPQEMLIAGAKKRGLDPIDVATAISYETGGTFDPAIPGPTTQHGQHQGLIQFGEPQAKQFGADFSDPQTAVRSQLDPDTGAVWKYLDSTGVKAGMGLPEIYSAINAGGVGRMGASDANNGGAPGTVADKVAGMGDHRTKAAQYLGGTWTPDANAAPVQRGGGQADIVQLMKVASSPYASPAQKAIVGALIQKQMQGEDPKSALELQLLQKQVDAFGKPKPQEPTGTMREYEYAKSQGFPGTFTDYQTAIKKAGASNQSVNVGQGSNEYNKEVDKNFAQKYIALQDASDSARGKMSILQELDRSLDSAGETGFGAESVLGVKRAAKALGVDVGDLSGEESAVALGNQLALMLRSPSGGAGMPGAMSDKDREFLVASVPSLTKTPAGNKRLIEYMMKVEQRNIDVAKMATDYANRNGQIDAGFYDELAQWSAGNDMFAGETTASASQPAADTFEAFAANPSAQAAATKYGVSIEEMWAIKQGQK